MAVVDKRQYVTTDNTPADALRVSGADSIEIVATASITSGDTSASIYRIAELPANYVPVWGQLVTAGITSLADVDLGLYETAEHGNAVIDVDALVDGVDISSAIVMADNSSAIAAISAANQAAALYTLASDTSSERQSYVLALTLNDTAGATGTLVVKLRLVRREYAS